MASFAFLSHSGTEPGDQIHIGVLEDVATMEEAQASFREEYPEDTIVESFTIPDHKLEGLKNLLREFKRRADIKAMSPEEFDALLRAVLVDGDGAVVADLMNVKLGTEIVIWDAVRRAFRIPTEIAAVIKEVDADQRRRGLN